MRIGVGIGIPGTQRAVSVTDALKAFGSLTFAADYMALPVGVISASLLKASFSAGSGIATFTSARSASAPATYTDANGVIQLVTTADVARIRGGYYGTSGFQKDKGLMIEPSSTNLLTRTDGTAYSSGKWTGWTSSGVTVTGPKTYSNVAVPELTSIANAASQRFQYTGVAGDSPGRTIGLSAASTAAGSVVQNDKITVSFWARSQTGLNGVTIVPVIDSKTAADAHITYYTMTDIASSITTSWRRFSQTITITDATSSFVSFVLKVSDITNGESVDVEFYGVQLEKLPYATSFIPTSTTALTRPAEVLKYENASNRTVSEETMFMRFSPMFGAGSDGRSEYFLMSDTKSRTLFTGPANAFMTTRPNEADNAPVQSPATTSLSAGVPHTYAGVVKHSSPYVKTFSNGTGEGTYTAGDWTNNAWGTYFYVGSTNAGGSQAHSAFKRVAFYSVAKSDADVVKISTVLSTA